MKLLKNIIDSVFVNKAEASRALKLLPLLVGVSLLIYFAKTDNSAPMPVVIYSSSDSIQTLYSTRPITRDTLSRKSKTTQGSQAIEVELFSFDPNTLDLEGFEALGFSTRQAQVIINYREAGAIFRKPEDFARCYTVSEEMFERLIPYINIGAKYQQQISANSSNPTNSSSPQGNSNPDYPQAAASDSASNTTSTTGLFSGDGFANSTSLRDTVEFPINLNTADSATLVLVRGIGPLTAGRIVEYRQKLGGFSSVEQLSEVKGMNERNYLTILEEIFIDSCGITKIDINFATPKQMSLHPYITDKALAKIIKNRQLRGGWRTIEEFKQDNILDKQELEQLRPYLLFNAQTAQ